MNSEPNFLLDVLFVTQVWRIAFRQKLRRADILRDSPASTHACRLNNFSKVHVTYFDHTLTSNVA